jgi:hypothetical protein
VPLHPTSTPWIRGRALPARTPLVEPTSKGSRTMQLQEEWERQKRAQQEERQRRAPKVSEADAPAQQADHRGPPQDEDPLEEEGSFNDEGTRG